MPSPTHLFDTNAVVDLLDAADYDALFGEATLELMFYEATNTLWHFAARRQKVSREEGAALVGQLADLRSEMRVVHLADLTAARVYEAAWDTSLTVYDSAYVVAADEYDLTLVTTDGGIHDHAPDGVDVVQPGDL